MASKASKSRYTPKSTPAALDFTYDRLVRPLTVDSLSQSRSDLNRAWNDYNSGHIDEAKLAFNKLCADLEQRLTLTPKESDRLPIRLLYGSAMSALGRVLQRLEANEEAQSIFKKAASEFRKSLPHSPQATDLMYSDYGVALFYIGNHTKAVEAFREAKNRGVLNAESNRYLGISLERLGNNKEAEEHFKDAVKQAPSEYSTHITLAKFLERVKKTKEAVEEYTIAINYLANAGLLDEALKVANRLLKLTKQDPHMLAIKGEILRLKLDYKSALKAVHASLKRDPKRAYALAVKGLIFLDQGNETEAVQLLEKAIKLEPTMDWAYVDLARALNNLGKFNKALTVLEKALGMQPDNPEALFLKAEVLHLSKRPKEALPVLNQTLKLTPNDAKVHGAKGQVLRELEKYDKALLALRRSIEIDPTISWVHAELGWLLYILGKNDEALQAMNEALAIQPDNVVALRQKGEVLRTLGKAEEALQLLHQAVTLAPNDAWALGTKGQILRDLGRDKEAVETLQKSIILDPEVAWVHVELSSALYNLEQYRDALEALDKGLKIEEHGDWQFFKGHMLCEIGDFGPAAKALDQSIKLGALPERFGLKGWALQHLGPKHTTEALKSYQTAVESSPDNLWWHKGVANGFYMLGDKAKASAKYRWVKKQARQQMDKEPDDTFLSLVGWCEFRLGKWEAAVQSFNRVLLSYPDEVATQFDLALALMCWEHYDEAGREYTRGVAIAKRKHPLRCRALVAVALDDLKLAIDHVPAIRKQEEAEATLSLLQSVYDESSK